jgi:hypothetical protein
MNRHSFEGGGDGWDPEKRLFKGLDRKQEFCYDLE